jgi:hypothetical protein
MARGYECRDVRGQIVQYPTLAAAIAAEKTSWHSGVESLSIWSSGPGLCVPASYRSAHHFVDACAVMERRHWPVVVRSTGGGCVPQGPGIVNLTWMPGPALSGTGIAGLYDTFAATLIRAMGEFGIQATRHSPGGAWCQGRHDICSNGRKLAGISQRRIIGAPNLALIHAAILIDCDLDLCFSEMELFLRTAGCAEHPLRGAATTMATETLLSASDNARQLSLFIRTVVMALSPHRTAK